MGYEAVNIKDIVLQNIKIKKQKWSEEELSLLSACIEQTMSLQNISKSLNRSLSSIYSKGNELGYGYYTDKKNRLKYFKPNINHKNRRTKKEILEGREFVSVATEMIESQGTDIEIASDIIPKKLAIDIVDLDIIIHILTTVRSGYEQQGTSTSTN